MAKIKLKESESQTWKDPIVEELHVFRAAYAKKFKYDLDAMFQDLKIFEKTLKEKMSKRSREKKKHTT